MSVPTFHEITPAGMLRRAAAHELMRATSLEKSAAEREAEAQQDRQLATEARERAEVFKAATAQLEAGQ